jgi:hypothetical protein
MDLIARLLKNFNTQRQIWQLGLPIPQIPDHVLDNVRPVRKVVHHSAGLDDGQHDQSGRQHVPECEPRAVMPRTEIFRLPDMEGARDCFLDVPEDGVVGFLIWPIALGCNVGEWSVEPGLQF